MLIFCVFMLSGLIGGVYRTLVEMDELKEENFFYHLIKNILLSAIAAFLVPLFLSLADNQVVDTLDAIKPLTIEFYKMLGFALLASVYAKNFIDGISDKVFDKVKNNEKTVKENTDMLATIVEENQKLKNEVDKSLLYTKIAKTESYLSTNHIKEGFQLIEEVLQSEHFYTLDSSEKCALLINKAYAIKRLEKSRAGLKHALAVLREAEEECPDNIDIWYNKSCYLALLKQEDELFELVRKVAEASPDTFKHYEDDEDFKEYLSDERYIRIKNL